MGRVLFGLAVLGISTAAYAQNPGAKKDQPQWIFFHSKETGRGPKLALTLKDGTKREVPVAADTVILSYIDGFVGAVHQSLSVDTTDNNRVLLWFDLPGNQKIQSAELVLDMEPSRWPPKDELTLGIYRITAAWDEQRTNWRDQPRYETQEIGTHTLPPRAAVHRIQLTNEVQRWLDQPDKNFGILLRVKTPLRNVPAQQAPQPGPNRKQNNPDDWIHIHTREMRAKGPQLLLELPDGTSRTLTPAADTGVISYLSDRAWGRLGFMAISLNDSNRVLLKFDLGGAGQVKSAHLILKTSVSPSNPVQPFEVAVHAIKKEWDEKGATWESQPAMNAQPLQTFAVTPAFAPRELKIDVTKAVQDGDAKHGWVLKVAKPLAKPVVRRDTRGQQAAGQRLLRRVVGWEPSIDAALARAQREKRLVLVAVDGTHDVETPSFGAKLMLTLLLADPDIKALIEKRYAAVRTAYHPQSYTTGRGTPMDPLRKVGSAIMQAKAPALVIADAKGEHIATMESLGTFDKRAVYAMLRKGLPAEEDEPSATPEDRARKEALKGNYLQALKLAPKGSTPRGLAFMRLGRFAQARAEFEAAQKTSPEAAYYLGCLDWRDGKRADAKSKWSTIVSDHGDSPWAKRAQFRLTWPERMAMYETLAASVEPGAKSTEVDRTKVKLEETVRRAAEYLLTTQRPDGAWPIGDAMQESSRSAITALAAHALLVWHEDLSKAQQPRAIQARAKARAWIKEFMKKTPAERANSFGTAYILDYQIGRFRKDKSAKADVQEAVDYLLGGQCDNGAWSYNRTWGQAWRGGFGGWPETDKGRVHSMNTGPALLFLAHADGLGLDVPGAKLERGLAALKRMKKGPAAFTYTWPNPISWEKPEFNIGRAPVCEQALWMLDPKGTKDLDRSLENFMKWRKDLRGPVKLTPGWTMPRGVSSYFYFFAYYHGARALKTRDAPGAAKSLAALRQDLLEVVEADGTWVDYPAIGKPYGTAMALLVLDLSRTK